MSMIPIFVALLASPCDQLRLSLAPGLSVDPPTSIRSSVGTIPLTEGRGCLRDAAGLKLDGFRYYSEEVEGKRSREVRYFPASLSLIRWPLDGATPGDRGSLILRREGASWAEGRSFALGVEGSNERPFVRFALEAGTWDAALVVPRYCPTFAAGIQTGDGDRELQRAALSPAARLLGRIKNSRTAKVLSDWRAYLRPSAQQARTEPAAALFEAWPIARDAPTLDFGSVPAGAWDLTIEAADHRRTKRPGLAFRPGQVVDVGDLFVMAPGQLRAHLRFPSQLPTTELVAAVWGEDRAWPGPTPLASRRVRPAPEVVVDFGDLAPGQVVLSVSTSPPTGLWRHVEVTVASAELADITEEFAPIKVFGSVLRGTAPVTDATVKLFQSPGESTAVATTGSGDYEAFVWSAGQYGIRVTAGQSPPVEDRFEIPAGEAEFPHDIALPNGSLRGVVLDDRTSEPLKGARVAFMTAPTERGTWDRTGQSGEVTTADDGTFRFDGLRTEPLNLEVHAADYAPAIRHKLSQPRKAPQSKFEWERAQP